MAYQVLGQVMPFLNTTDLSAKQYHLMLVSAANTVDTCGAAGIAIGILQNDPTANQGASVLTARGVITQLEIGGNVSAANTLESDSAGKGVAFTIDGAGATETWCVAVALEGGVSGDIISVLTVFAPASK